MSLLPGLQSREGSSQQQPHRQCQGAGRRHDGVVAPALVACFIYRADVHHLSAAGCVVADLSHGTIEGRVEEGSIAVKQGNPLQACSTSISKVDNQCPFVILAVGQIIGAFAAIHCQSDQLTLRWVKIFDLPKKKKERASLWVKARVRVAGGRNLRWNGSTCPRCLLYLKLQTLRSPSNRRLRIWPGLAGR